MDCDDVSLPDTETQDAAWQRAQDRRTLAMTHVRLDYGEDVPSLGDLSGELDRYHNPAVAELTITHQELDSRIASGIFARLGEAVPANQLILPPRRPPAPGHDYHDDIDELRNLAYGIDNISRNPGLLQSFSTLRILDMTGNHLNDNCTRNLRELLLRSSTLRHLNLSANEFGQDPKLFELFGFGVATSTLTSLNLGSNPIKWKSLANFLAALQQTGSCLEELHIHNLRPAVARDEFKERARAARSIAELVSGETRCRRLRRLEYDLLDFNALQCRLILASLVGSVWSLREGLSDDARAKLADAEQQRDWDSIVPRRERRRNRNLAELQFPVVTSPDKIFEDVVLEEARPGSLGAFLKTASPDHKRLVLKLLKRQHRRRPEDGQDPREDKLAHSIMSRASVDLENWTWDYEDAIVFDSGLHLLSFAEWRDAQRRVVLRDRQRVRAASLRVFKVARILCCRVRRGSHQGAGLTRFWNLPPELQLLIVRHLDHEAVLSETQFLDILSYAGERETIGFGQVFYDWMPITRKLTYEWQGPGMYDEPSSGVPHDPWSWPTCFRRRARPQDWPGVAEDHRRCTQEDLPPDLIAFLHSTATDTVDPSSTPRL